MRNNHARRAKPIMPSITTVAGGFQVNYEPSLGWRMFPYETNAKEDLVNFIDMRVDNLSREMFELCRMKRRMLKVK